MNGNGELTETENVIFYVSYGVLTEFLRMNVILTYSATETAMATATATATDTERWKSGISVQPQAPHLSSARGHTKQRNGQQGKTAKDSNGPQKPQRNAG